MISAVKGPRLRRTKQRSGAPRLSLERYPSRDVVPGSGEFAPAQHVEGLAVGFKSGPEGRGDCSDLGELPLRQFDVAGASLHPGTQVERIGAQLLESALAMEDPDPINGPAPCRQEPLGKRRHHATIET